MLNCKYINNEGDCTNKDSKYCDHACFNSFVKCFDFEESDDKNDSGDTKFEEKREKFHFTGNHD